MAYATVAEMRDFLPRIEISDATNPSTAQVERQLDLVSAKIDGILSAQGYSVPVTADDALELLRSVCLYGAGFWVVTITWPNATSGLVDHMKVEYNAMMGSLMEGKMELPGVERNTSLSLESYVLTADSDAQAAMEPFIARDTEF